MFETLKRFGDACVPFQEMHAPPFRFRASIPEGLLQFNAELAMNLVWLDKKPALHIVDSQTCYQNAAFIRGMSPECLWKLLVETRATLYWGFPDIL